MRLNSVFLLIMVAAIIELLSLFALTFGFLAANNVTAAVTMLAEALLLFALLRVFATGAALDQGPTALFVIATMIFDAGVAGYYLLDAATEKGLRATATTAAPIHVHVYGQHGFWIALPWLIAVAFAVFFGLWLGSRRQPKTLTQTEIKEVAWNAGTPLMLTGPTRAVLPGRKEPARIEKRRA